jgi:hypothetical protein
MRSYGPPRLLISITDENSKDLVDPRPDPFDPGGEPVLGIGDEREAALSVMLKPYESVRITGSTLIPRRLARSEFWFSGHSCSDLPKRDIAYEPHHRDLISDELVDTGCEVHR